jgi:hypothetical protein
MTLEDETERLPTTINNPLPTYAVLTFQNIQGLLKFPFFII